MSAHFVKKPVEIEAVRFTPDNADEIISWINTYGDDLALYNDLGEGDGYIAVNTLEGHMRANRGDWIIKGVKDEFYPCRNDIFEATYESLTEEDLKSEEVMEELRSVINRHSLENESGTPDFLLAAFLNSVLVVFNHTVAARAEWRGERPDLFPGRTLHEEHKEGPTH